MISELNKNGTDEPNKAATLCKYSLVYLYLP